MSLAVPQEIAQLLSLSLRVDALAEYPGQSRIAVSLEPSDDEPRTRDALDEYFDRYEWGLRVSVTLANGEVRRGWRGGSNDDAKLVDNGPHADLCVPSAPAGVPAVVRAEGWLERCGGRDAACIDWAHEFLPAQTAVALPAIALAAAPVDDGASAGAVARSLDVEVRSLGGAPPAAHFVACLPEIGLAEAVRAPDGTWRYRLHTAAGPTDLHGVQAAIDALPGRARPFSDVRVVGGPAGRLAVHLTRDGAFGEVDRVSAHLLLFELPGERLLAHVADAGGSAVDVVDGFFDDAGARYVCHARLVATFLDVETGRVVARWPNAPSMGSHGRAQLAGTTLSGCSERHEAFVCDAGADARPRAAPFYAAPGACAFHPGAALLACLVRDPRFASASLLTFDRATGTRQLPLPRGAEGPVAVLADGRVLVAGERLLLVEPARAEVVDLGAMGDPGERLLLCDDGRATWLWTRDPARWALRVP